MHGVSDPRGVPVQLALLLSRVLPSARGDSVRTPVGVISGSMPGLHMPLLTLRSPPYGWPRIARGRDGSLLLSRSLLHSLHPAA
jgi:hypothetical protein